MFVYVSLTADGSNPWALAASSLAAVSADGDSFADLLLEAGNGGVWLLVAPDSMDPTRCVWADGGHVIDCYLALDGAVWVDGSAVRDATPGWGGCMAPGESVRVRYVAATRMVSVVRHGREYELTALPAAWDASHYRFGIAMTSGNAMLLAGASVTCMCAAPCGTLRRRDRACVRGFFCGFRFVRKDYTCARTVLLLLNQLSIWCCESAKLD